MAFYRANIAAQNVQGRGCNLHSQLNPAIPSAADVIFTRGTGMWVLIGESEGRGHVGSLKKIKIVY